MVLNFPFVSLGYNVIRDVSLANAGNPHLPLSGLFARAWTLLATTRLSYSESVPSLSGVTALFSSASPASSSFPRDLTQSACWVNDTPAVTQRSPNNEVGLGAWQYRMAKRKNADLFYLRRRLPARPRSDRRLLGRAEKILDGLQALHFASSISYVRARIGVAIQQMHVEAG